MKAENACAENKTKIAWVISSATSAHHVRARSEMSGTGASNMLHCTENQTTDAHRVRWTRLRSSWEAEMHDVLAQLRAAVPMPRGERLYAARHATPRKPPHRMLGVFDQTRRKELGDAFYADNIRVYAAPLALARERRRRERAERIAEERKAALFQAWADEQATSAMFHERGREIDALRAEVARLQPPTREEVERAVKNMLDARERAFRWPFESSGYQAAITAAIDATDALVKLATRGKE